MPTSEPASPQSGTKRIGVIAADPLRALGLEAILSELAGLRVVSLDLARLTARDKDVQSLDAAVLDARSVGNGLRDLLSRLRREQPKLKVIVLGETQDPDFVGRIIGAGAKGFLTETAAEGEIRMALEVVLDGSVWAPRKVLARLIEEGGLGNSSAAGSENVLARMTPREIEVLELLKDGRTNRDIAKAMGIDETTVKAHLGRMLRKTGATNRVELTLRAIGSHS